MSLLGDFLESFYGSGHTFQSVHAHVRHDRWATARGESSRRQVIGRVKAAAAKSSVTTEELVFWAVMPDLVRVNTTSTNDGHTETTIEIARGQEKLERMPDGSVEIERTASRRRGNILPTDFRRHFDRSLIREFFASLILEQIGECQVAGRECVCIRALPVPGDQIWPHWLACEADEFHFAADVSVPSLLAITALLSGTKIESHEVVEIAFDEQIDATLFNCEPIPGQSIRPAVPVVERISLKTAASKVPFAIVLPTAVPGGESNECRVMYHPPRANVSDEHLTIFYQNDEPSRLWITLRAHPDPKMENELDWEELKTSGRTFKLSDPKTDGGLSVLAFEQDGTHVEIVSDLSRSQLLNLALSFHR